MPPTTEYSKAHLNVGSVGRGTEATRYRERQRRRRARVSRAAKEIELATWGKRFGIISKDEDARVVTAWASVVEKGGELVEDHEGDVIFPEDLENAAWEFVANVRKAGLNHERTEGIGGLVGSMVFTRELQKQLDIDLGQVGWLVQFHITDDDVWQRVKTGDLPMMSIHGQGERTAL